MSSHPPTAGTLDERRWQRSLLRRFDWTFSIGHYHHRMAPHERRKSRAPIQPKTIIMYNILSHTFVFLLQHLTYFIIATEAFCIPLESAQAKQPTRRTNE
jgi:hypothetical protein